MRTTHILGWLLVCLVVGGCSSFKWGKNTSTKGGASASRETADPFVLSSGGATAPKDPVNGVLAGYAFDRWRNPLADATIEIVDLNEPVAGGKRAKITTTTDRIGQYKFEGLNPSHQYQLIARTRDGNRQLVGTVLGAPPNPRLPIFLTEDVGGYDPKSAAKDKEPDGKTSATNDRTNTIAAPAATLDPPVRGTDLDAPPAGPTPTNSLPGTGIPGPGEDRSRTTQDGFHRNPIVAVPGPSTTPTPPLPAPPRTPTPAPIPPAPPPSGDGPQANLGAPLGPSPSLPEVPVTTPSCLLVGSKLTNFSLINVGGREDVDGKPWVYSRDRDKNARVVLLDFWYSTCGPCLASLPELRGLQSHYGPYGLQIIGITHEPGTYNEAAPRIRGARSRYNINYPTLFSSASGPPCPVVSQFQVTGFPSMVLLDDTGKIIWKKVGPFDPQSKAELELLLRKKLGLQGQ